MSKFYTAMCQAKELCAEAKTTMEKAKELKNEILLKKGEVIRLTDEVKELKTDAIKKETSLLTWRDKFLGLHHL